MVPRLYSKQSKYLSRSLNALLLNDQLQEAVSGPGLCEEGKAGHGEREGHRTGFTEDLPYSDTKLLHKLVTREQQRKT